ncbi:MAG: glycoside hydrolase family 127 protein [Acidobacteriota bacterium]|nr:glycoside hydrolase family 127 protein [Acidobacteriota bacterium]
MAIPRRCLSDAFATVAFQPPLEQFGYNHVTLHSEPHERQLRETHAVLMELNEDSVLKPLRQMSGQPAPGDDLSGWYRYGYDEKLGKETSGYAPGCTFGQWVSALARIYAITGDRLTREKVLRLNRLYAKTISGEYYDRNRFPAYCYDKILCGLIDSHQFVGDPDAFRILDQTTDVAMPHLPGKAIENGKRWRMDKDEAFANDESYTNSENMFIAFQRGAGSRYRDLGKQYLFDEYYDPLSKGANALAGWHAYSYINSLSSAMQAYLTLGSEKHFGAAKNGFDLLTAQSFATGGWGPDEQLRATGSSDLYDSLTNTHSSFETPCGSYAHFKLTRYLMRVTRESLYGDSMERVMYNTILGAKPLRLDGSTFYYSDYNSKARKVYRDDKWPCCSGTHPQVVADYRINTYFRDPSGVWVNLYIPSTVRWEQGGADVTLQQNGDYPFDSVLQFTVKISKARNFAINFRIPAWADKASLSVNGRRLQTPAAPGSFAAIHRQWSNGDRVELEIPMTLRLEPLDSQHLQTVALVFGPVVLFAITDNQPPLTGPQLLAAKRIDRRTWQVSTSSTPMKLLPFTDIGDEQYSTYLNVTTDTRTVAA